MQRALCTYAANEFVNAETSNKRLVGDIVVLRDAWTLDWKEVVVPKMLYVDAETGAVDAVPRDVDREYIVVNVDRVMTCAHASKEINIGRVDVIVQPEEKRVMCRHKFAKELEGIVETTKQISVRVDDYHLEHNRSRMSFIVPGRIFAPDCAKSASFNLTRGRDMCVKMFDERGGFNYGIMMNDIICD